MSTWHDLERNAERTLRVLTDAGLSPDDVVTENNAVMSWSGTPVIVVVYDDSLTDNVHALSGGTELWTVNVWDLVDRAGELTVPLRSAIAGARSAA